MSEGGSWKGLLCIFIGSTITTIPTANLAVPHYTSGDELVLEQRSGRHSELFLQLRVHNDRQDGRGWGGSLVNTMAPVNQVGTFAVTKTGLSPSCSRSGYQTGALKRD